MTGNKFKKQQKEKVSSGNGRTGRFFASLLDGSLVTGKSTPSLLPFIFYLSALALFLIFNAYYAERKARQVDQLQQEMTTLRINYVQTKSEYMYLTNRSEISRRLRTRGFIEPNEPPRPVYELDKNKGFIDRILGRN
ncbi:MAG: FtsL-like putative cell division protein [Bacteroidales bacterium]